MKTSPCKVEKQCKQPSFAFLYSPRCGAKTRRGTACKNPAVRGKKRCRMHGGGKGTGAQKDNKNALKHGMTTRGMKKLRGYVRTLLADNKIFIKYYLK